jgi:hypothetical protein
MARMGRIGRALALGLVLLAPLAGCGGASDRGASEPTDTGGELEPDAECCCQRYAEDGSATGAITSDKTACKSTGGSCIDDTTQCESE